MTNKIPTLSIPRVNTLEELRASIQNAFTRLVDHINAGKITGNLDANGFRITNVDRPFNLRDAANKQYVLDILEIAKRHTEVTVATGGPPPSGGGDGVDLRDAFGFNTAEFEIVPGGFQIKGVDLTKGQFFDSTNFIIQGGQFDIKTQGITGTEISDGAITTPKLTTSEINIGGGGSKPIRFRIFNAAGTPIAWIGDDTAFSGFDGAWFKRLLVGGTGPSTANFFADSSGNVVLKSVFAFDATGTIGWIGSSGIYKGGWFKEFYAGGSGPASAVIIGTAAGGLSINGAPLTLTLNGVTTKITNELVQGGFQGLQIYESATGNSGVVITPGAINILGNISSGQRVFLAGGSGLVGQLRLYDTASTARVTLSASVGGITCLNSSSITEVNLASLGTGGELKLYNSSGSLRAQLTGVSGGVLDLYDGLGTNSKFDGINKEIIINAQRVISTRKAAVIKPSGGATIDTEARTAIDAIIDRLRVTGGHGLISD